MGRLESDFDGYILINVVCLVVVCELGSVGFGGIVGFLVFFKSEK